MLSDDSSTDSESGRFKTHAKSERKNTKNDTSRHSKRSEPLPDLGRSRNSDRHFGRQFDRRHEDRGRFDRRRSRERYDTARRHSPRRRHSRDRSPEFRRTPDRPRQSREVRKHSRSVDKDCDKRDYREKKSDVVEHKPKDDQGRKRPSPIIMDSGIKRNFREEIRKNIVANISQDKTPQHESSRNEKEKYSDCSSSKRKHISPDTHKTKETSIKRSEVHIPVETIHVKSKSKSPVKDKSASVEKEIRRSKSRRYSEEDETSDLDQPASYYNLVPATANIPDEVASIHSITDSDDEERLRAKLLNIESELHKSKKKKTKKSKKKSKSKHKDKDDPVEVSSTTDIQANISDHETISESQMQAAEVSSTQQKPIKESIEEGEITTDDDSANVSMDVSDLRHRLKRSTALPDTSGSPDLRQKLKAREVSGPALPPHLEARAKHSISPDTEGPVLPPHFRKDRTIGPTVPSDMRKVLAEASHDEPIQYESSEDEGIGPLPAGAEQKWTAAHKKLEERALDMKIRSLEGSGRSDAKSREEWMLELPASKAKYCGLGPRQFRSKEAPDMSDRSSWTDTPQDKALKAAGLAPAEEASSASLQREAHERYVADRDRDQEKAVKKHKKKHKRDESLLEMHQKKLKKKKKKEEKEEGVKRRPFDRDVDLQANRFDDAQKQAIIKKAQHLDTRFSSGEAKYL